jgi:hypothetical protein
MTLWMEPHATHGAAGRLRPLTIWLVGRGYLSAHSMEPLLEEEKAHETVAEEVAALTTA